ncbi:hypothetical protein [Desulfobacterium sp. N47]|uniref:Uncharacterized protein n=1 Tax=uncultured Desulfobacterium sp. TaxID=201089 RepID=E1Y8I8_9BACT|nr:unknown protein [uncultured Desulfobacterium sp.]
MGISDQDLEVFCSKAITDYFMRARFAYNIREELKMLIDPCQKMVTNFQY